MTDNNNSEDDKDDGMTPEQREEWLKDRGVQIETPSDRRRAEKASSGDSVSILDQMIMMRLQDSDADDGSQSHEQAIKFVYIPHDDSRPVRTLSVPVAVSQSIPGDALPEYVKPYFAADRTSIDASLLKEQAMKQFAGGDLQQLAETKLSAETMNAVASQGSVETFPLVHPADTNQMTAVNVYLDEVGLLKKLPTNRRVSQLAEACGYNPAPNFYGDVFVGRVKTQPKLDNIDFVAGVDTDPSSATWIQRAVSENLAWQQEMNKVTGKTGQTQLGQAGTDGAVATEDSFTWTQDDDELEIIVPDLAGAAGIGLNKNVVKVNFKPRSIKIVYDGTEKLSFDLYNAIDVDGCTWTIDRDKLVITCEKSESGATWPRVKLGR
mmetsp:Transcript_35027/g.84765  ORF Transcript_35027/g.84765 Transcript_35027/m.84765 type:complete len:379 (+) Transcript_35027:123-1259(+)